MKYKTITVLSLFLVFSFQAKNVHANTATLFPKGLPAVQMDERATDILRQNLIHLFDSAQFHHQVGGKAHVHSQEELAKRIEDLKAGSYLSLKLDEPAIIYVEGKALRIKQLWASIRVSDGFVGDLIFEQPDGSLVILGKAIGDLVVRLAPYMLGLLDEAFQVHRLGIEQARASAEIAGLTLSKIQRWLHEVALEKIDPETKLYISHHRGSGRYPEALWNYDDAAADTYPFLFWAAWYTDHEKINGPILDVLEAEQRICNHLDRIPTAVNHKTLEKVIKSKDKMIFAASEYLKDGLLAIVEVSGPETPWFDRMQGIVDDIWKHADIETPYGKIPTENLEANGEQIQILVRLYTITGEEKYLRWAERLADYYLLDEDFMPTRLRDHGCEIIGGLGLLFGVESVHNPAKAEVYRPRLKRIFDEILERGVNEDGLMYNVLGKPGALSDSWGYNYVSFLCYDMAVGEPVYREHLKETLQNLTKPKYKDYPWERQSVDGFADSVEGALYLLNRIDVPETVEWTNHEVANNIIFADKPKRMLSTYKLESNGVRTALQHALMHTRGLIARPWKQDLKLGATESEEGLAVVIQSEEGYEGLLIFDIPRHRLYMGFQKDWPRMNTMPEWFTVDPDLSYIIEDLKIGTRQVYSGLSLYAGLPIKVDPGGELRLLVKQTKRR